MNQQTRVIRLLRGRPSSGITAKDAIDVGVYRLAARVHELRLRGFNIIGKLEKAKNRYGDPVKYMRYWLDD